MSQVYSSTDVLDVSAHTIPNLSHAVGVEWLRDPGKDREVITRIAIAVQAVKVMK